MFGLVRLAIIAFFVLTIVYICLSMYSRSKRRKKLQEDWHDSDRSLDSTSFVEAGLDEYDGSLRRKLILGVYVVPTLLVCFIIYATNFM